MLFCRLHHSLVDNVRYMFPYFFMLFFPQAVLWNMDTLKLKSSLEEHSLLITDVRFSPNSTRLATSSFDKTVRVWDADNVSCQVILLQYRAFSFSL